jgi:hypothetical protein
MTIRALAGVVAMLATSWLLGSYYDRFWYPPDEGNYAHVAQRILDGETLNLQVQDVHPGYISFVNAAALRAFGSDLVSLRYPLVLVGLLQAAVLFFVFPGHDPWRAAVASIALTALGAIQFLNPTAHWHCLALVILLIATLGPVPRTSRQLLAVGILIGTIALFRQLTGFLAGVGTIAFLLWDAGERGTHGSDALMGRAFATTMAVALACYLALATDVTGIVLFGVWPVALLVLLVFRPQAPNREVARIAGTAAAGVAIAAIPLVAYHVWHGSLQAWAEDVGPAAVALTRLDFFERSNFGVLVFHGLRQVVTGRDAPMLLNGLYWAALPLLAAINGFVVFRLLTRARGYTVAPLPVMAVFYAVVSVHFQIPVYLYYTAGLSLASLLWLAPRVSPLAARASIAFALVLSATGVYFHAGQPASRGMAGLLGGERTQSARASTLPHSSLRIGLDEGRRYATLVELIRREVPADGAILAVPSNAELYFLSQRRNAFRFYNTALGIRTNAELAAVEQTLRDHPPRLVTFNRDDKYNTPRSLMLMEAVKHRYVLLGRFEPFDVYVLP